RRRIAVRDVNSGDLVVPRRRCGRVSALGDEPLRLILWLRVVDRQVEEVRGIESVALLVQRVTSVLYDGQVAIRPECDVVEAGVRDVREIEQLEGAIVRAGRRELQLEQTAEAT